MSSAKESVDATSATGRSRSVQAGQKRANGKREKIVRSAAKLFLEKGYDNVSINDIIDVTGGSKGTIYSNFGSKEKLFEAVVERMCADVTIRVDTRTGGTPRGATDPHRTFLPVEGAVAGNPLFSSPYNVDRADLSEGRAAFL